AAARGGAQRGISQVSQRLHDASQSQAWNHGLGPSKRIARRDGYGGENAPARYLGSGVRQKLVAGFGRENHLQDSIEPLEGCKRLLKGTRRLSGRLSVWGGSTC